MKRVRKEKAVTPDGFSRWVQPRMDGYGFQCCDCGLVHELQFRIAPGRIIKRRESRNGGQKMHVQFRARRK